MSGDRAGLESLLAQQQSAWRVGSRARIETLVAQSDGSSAAGRETLLALICNEVVLREQSGETPTLEEYQARFPDLSKALRIQWEVDRLLAETDQTPLPSDGTQSQNACDTRLGGAPTVAGPDRQDERGVAAGHIGRFELQNEVGRGAMGVVYRAWDPLLKRTVAVKRLRAGLDTDRDEMERVTTEAEAIAKVQHPNIIQIFDVGSFEGHPFFAMEFCPGGSLAQRLNGTPFDARTSAMLASQIAAGVAKAHANRVIHRDLKPANILLVDESTWTLKITDFGLAKQLDDDRGATATGNILGTPAYMAPEQAFGGSKRVGPAADVYAIGAILYECLTGRPPFCGATIADTLEQVRQVEPVRVRQLQPRVPIDLETIVHKCLRKEPNARYATAAELADDLERFLRGDAIAARRETRFEAAARIFRRNPAVCSLAATAVVMLLLMVVGSLSFARRLKIELKLKTKAVREALLGQADAHVGHAHGIRLSRRPGQRFAALSAIRQAVQIGRELNQPKNWYDPIRDEAIAALLLPDAYVQHWWTEPYPVEYADLSEDESLYALSCTGIDEILVRRFSDHVEVGRIPKIEKSTTVCFVGSDRLFTVGQKTATCEVWEISAPATLRRLWRLDDGSLLNNFTRDGRLLATMDKNHLRVVDVSTGAILAKLPVGPFSRDGRLSLHPTEPLVVLLSYLQPTVQLRNWRTGETLQELEPADGHDDYPGYYTADWSPDGRRLLVVNAHEDAAHWYDLNSDTLRLQPCGTKRPAGIKMGGGPSVLFNALGDRILGTRWANCFSIQDSENLDLIIQSEPLKWRSFGWKPPNNPASKYRYFAGKPENPKSLGAMSIADAREACIVVSAEHEVGAGSLLDPSGRFLLGVVPDGVIFVEFATGRHIFTFPLKDFVVGAFDHRGNFYLTGQTGSFRWPYELSDSKPLRIALGVPERVQIPYGNGRFACCSDGETIVAGAWDGFGTQEYAGCWIKPAGEPAARKILGDANGTDCAVSPNGRYVVGNHDAGGTLIWDCEAGIKMIHKLPWFPRPQFSSDGKWLLAGGKRLPTNTLRSDVCFSEGMPVDLSSDGSLVLTHRQDGAIYIFDAASGNQLARFEWKEKTFDPFFSPGDEQIVFSSEGAIVQIDIPLVRAGLAELGLDWLAGAGSSQPRLASSHKQSEPKALASGGGTLGVGTLDRNSTEVMRPSVKSLFGEGQGMEDSAPATLAPELRTIATIDQLAELVDQRALAKADHEPTNPSAAFAAAMAAIEQRDFDLALGHLNRTCQLLPEAITPRLWRAYLLAAMRDYPRAIEDANWVIDRKGSGAFVMEGALSPSSEFSSARETPDSLDITQKKTPQTVERPIDVDFRLLRAEWCYRAKQFDASIADCSHVIRGGGKWTSYAYGLRSVCYEVIGNSELAKSDQAKFMELTHVDASTLNMAAGPMSGRDISLRHPTIALRVVRKLQSLDLELDETIEHTIGRVFYQNDLYEEAARWIEDCLSRGEGQYDAFDLNILAMAYRQLGKYDDAEKARTRAVAWKPAKPLDFHDRCDLRALQNECVRAFK